MKKTLIRALAALTCICTAVCCTKTEEYDMADHIGACREITDAALLKEAGASYIEVAISRFLMPESPDSAFQENLSLAEASPLPVISGNGFYPGDIRLIGPEAETDRAVAYARKAFERGAMIGMKYFVLGSGKARTIPEGFDPAEARAQFVDLCKKIAPYAEAAGITIVIEPLRREETNFINTVHEGCGIVKDVNHPALCVLADLYHMTQESEGPESIIEAGAALRHCHIAEDNGRMAPGTGGQDFTPYFKALKEIGYKGNISIECRWNDFENQVSPAIAEIKRQLESL